MCHTTLLRGSAHTKAGSGHPNYTLGIGCNKGGASTRRKEEKGGPAATLTRTLVREMWEVSDRREGVPSNEDTPTRAHTFSMRVHPSTFLDVLQAQGRWGLSLPKAGGIGGLTSRCSSSSRVRIIMIWSSSPPVKTSLSPVPPDPSFIARVRCSGDRLLQQTSRSCTAGRTAPNSGINPRAPPNMTHIKLAASITPGALKRGLGAIDFDFKIVIIR